MSRVLVVDDEVGIRELLSEILYDEGHTVELAENAAQARAARLRARPDLVLLDIWMPDTDGVSLLKEWVSQGRMDMRGLWRGRGHASERSAGGQCITRASTTRRCARSQGGGRRCQSHRRLRALPQIGLNNGGDVLADRGIAAGGREGLRQRRCARRLRQHRA